MVISTVFGGGVIGDGDGEGRRRKEYGRAGSVLPVAVRGDSGVLIIDGDVVQRRVDMLDNIICPPKGQVSVRSDEGKALTSRAALPTMRLGQRDRVLVPPSTD